MKINITGKNFNPYQKLEDDIAKKLDKLGKYFSDDISAKVVLSQEREARTKSKLLSMQRVRFSELKKLHQMYTKVLTEQLTSWLVRCPNLRVNYRRDIMTTRH